MLTPTPTLAFGRIIIGFRLLLGLALLVTTVLLVIPVPAVVPDVIGLDKLEHMLVFTVLAGLADYAFPARRYNFSKALPLLAYGIGMEFVQWALPYRSFSIMDMIADGSGLLFYRFLGSYIESLPSLRLRRQLHEQNNG